MKIQNASFTSHKNLLLINPKLIKTNNKKQLKKTITIRIMGSDNDKKEERKREFTFMIQLIRDPHTLIICIVAFLKEEKKNKGVAPNSKEMVTL